jgi:hypothetical protein
MSFSRFFKKNPKVNRIENKNGSEGSYPFGDASARPYPSCAPSSTPARPNRRPPPEICPSRRAPASRFVHRLAARSGRLAGLRPAQPSDKNKALPRISIAWFLPELLRLAGLLGRVRLSPSSSPRRLERPKRRCRPPSPGDPLLRFCSTARPWQPWSWNFPAFFYLPPPSRGPRPLGGQARRLLWICAEWGIHPALDLFLRGGKEAQTYLIDCSVNECSAGICSHSDLNCKIYICSFVGNYVIIFLHSVLLMVLYLN